MTVRERLIKMAEPEYRDFSSSLMPTVDKSFVLGVRVPRLRSLARELRGTKEADELLEDLPHRYYEEYLLHGFLVECIGNFEECTRQLDLLLPYLNSWSLTDSISPRVYAKNKDKLLPLVDKWLASGHEYTVRFGILMLMKHFLDSDFLPEHAERVAALRCDGYYVNMMVAWYFATALAKQYDVAVKYLEQRRLSPWIHARTIQKACESYRISPDIKRYLKSLK